LARLGPGEADVIALATQYGEDALVVLDDADGRRLARDQGIALLGSAGVLVLAKERGVIRQVRPLLDDLRAAGLYLSDAAYRDVLTLANEGP
jgi:predicted nucleic acid-binding protein